MEINYRILNSDDLASYRRVRLDCIQQYATHFGTTYEEEVLKDQLKFDVVLLKNNSDDFMMGAFSPVDNMLIGTCGFITEKRIKTSHRGNISQLYVQATFGGNGIGKTLLTRSIEKAFSLSRIEQITLGAVSDNPVAIKLYNELGFIEYGRLENYFKTKKNYSTHLMFVLSKTNWKTI